MYSFTTPITSVEGVGPQRAAVLQEAGITTVGDLLLRVPLRYEDRSTITTIADAPVNELFTLSACVDSLSENRRGRLLYTRAKLSDETGSLTAIWFNNKFVKHSLKVGEWYSFSGKISDRGSLTQPQFEKSAAPEDSIHTGRLVPIYSTLGNIPPGGIRRLLKHVLSHLETSEDPIAKLQHTNAQNKPPLSLMKVWPALHFPDDPEVVVEARERLAVEEIIALIRHSHQLKNEWLEQRARTRLNDDRQSAEIVEATALPFTLTTAQLRSFDEILHDLQQPQPMNRLLLGDVGSGKTIVAALIAREFIRLGQRVAVVAPTRMLAQQHAKSIAAILPDLPIELMIGGSKTAKTLDDNTPRLIIGTHAVLNRLEALQPALIVYDEQHRFGVVQRSARLSQTQPHILTMTATPIPRSLLLTIFSHLQVSILDELPANRLPTKTWYLPEKKRASMWQWVVNQATEASNRKETFLTLVVCPFIDQSETPAFEHVVSAQTTFAQLQKELGTTLRVGLLHGRQKAAQKDDILKALYAGEIDVLVTTPIVEVGVDLPQASAVIIESAERYGLSSLHQLRGRVGRAGQQGYCYIFTSPGIKVSHKAVNTASPTVSSAASSAVSTTTSPTVAFPPSLTTARLQAFTQTTNGSELAELDLQQRGAGDLFGTRQSGLDNLRFAEWSNVELIRSAQLLEQQLPPSWQPLPQLKPADDAVLAN